MSIVVSCKEIKQRAISALHMSALIIVLIRVSPTSWKLLTHYKKLQQKNEKILYCGGMMICIITWIWTINDIIIDMECINKLEFSESGIERIIYAAMYLIQLILLLLVFFLNIFYIFRETPWKLSKLSIRLYQLIFCLICIICVIIIITLDHIDIRLSILLSMIMMILIFSLMISLIVSYIHRLIGVYKINTNDDKLVCYVVFNCFVYFFLCTQNIQHAKGSDNHEIDIAGMLIINDYFHEYTIISTESVSWWIYYGMATKIYDLI